MISPEPNNSQRQSGPQSDVAAQLVAALVRDPTEHASRASLVALGSQDGTVANTIFAAWDKLGGKTTCQLLGRMVAEHQCSRAVALISAMIADSKIPLETRQHAIREIGTFSSGTIANLLANLARGYNSMSFDQSPFQLLGTALQTHPELGAVVSSLSREDGSVKASGLLADLKRVFEGGWQVFARQQQMVTVQREIFSYELSHGSGYPEAVRQAIQAATSGWNLRRSDIAAEISAGLASGDPDVVLGARELALLSASRTLPRAITVGEGVLRESPGVEELQRRFNDSFPQLKIDQEATRKWVESSIREALKRDTITDRDANFVSRSVPVVWPEGVPEEIARRLEVHLGQLLTDRPWPDPKYVGHSRSEAQSVDALAAARCRAADGGLSWIRGLVDSSEPRLFAWAARYCGALRGDAGQAMLARLAATRDPRIAAVLLSGLGDAEIVQSSVPISSVVDLIEYALQVRQRRPGLLGYVSRHQPDTVLLNAVSRFVVAAHSYLADKKIQAALTAVVRANGKGSKESWQALGKIVWHGTARGISFDPSLEVAAFKHVPRSLRVVVALGVSAENLARVIKTAAKDRSDWAELFRKVTVTPEQFAVLTNPIYSLGTAAPWSDIEAVCSLRCRGITEQVRVVLGWAQNRDLARNSQAEIRRLLGSLVERGGTAEDAELLRQSVQPQGALVKLRDDHRMAILELAARIDASAS